MIIECPFCHSKDGVNVQEIVLTPIMESRILQETIKVYAVCCGHCDKVITFLPHGTDINNR